MSSIAIFGAGRVGLVTAACLADFGNVAVCVDPDARRIGGLASGETPFREEGLAELVSRNVLAGRLSFSVDPGPAIQASEILFIAVGTPPAGDGSADLGAVEAAAREIGRRMEGYRIIVEKSTAPVGTGRRIGAWLGEELAKRRAVGDFDVVANPEFLREGSAVGDFLRPDRVVIGAESGHALEAMRELYRPIHEGSTPFVETDLESAEMAKCASNAFLAVKLAFVNEMASLCERVGADSGLVAAAMGMDRRIGPGFLEAGPGFGGPCLPKDAAAFADMARRRGSRARIVEAAVLANDEHRRSMVDKIESALGSAGGKTIAVLGLAFKAGTEDVREAPAMGIIEGLVARGGRVKAYDPAAMGEARLRLCDLDGGMEYCADEYEAARGADALVILTEWEAFRNLDLRVLKGLLRRPILCDLRNLYDRSDAEELGFAYIGVGR